MKIFTTYKKLQADLHTPVSLYLKLRDKYADPLLLESSDYHSGNESSSVICLDPLSSFTCGNGTVTLKTTGSSVSEPAGDVVAQFRKFREGFSAEKLKFPFPYSGFFGFTSYGATKYFEGINTQNDLPELHYAFYSLVIVINHFNDEMYVFSHAERVEDADRQLNDLLTAISYSSFPAFGFSVAGEEQSDCTDEKFMEMVREGKRHCRRGDVFQVVLSRKFISEFAGDEFQVYRALRNVNPSPYLYYFDFGSFRMFGSSPEAQLVVKNNIAEIHPIAGTVKRSGDDVKDLEAAQKLKLDEKENAEHIMLVDLARNDLSRHCRNVKVEDYREIQFYSHVIHLVSKVTGEIKNNADVYEVMKDSFPAGTLSGAPKVRAMQIISELEQSHRGFYGGAVGFIGCDGSFNHAIVIRSFLSKGNQLTYRAGAGIVNASDERSELNEVENKIGALRKALAQATNENIQISKTAQA